MADKIEQLTSELKRAQGVINSLSLDNGKKASVIEWQNNEITRLHAQIKQKASEASALQGNIEALSKNLSVAKQTFERDLLSVNRAAPDEAGIGEVGTQHSGILFNHESRIAALEMKLLGIKK